MVHIIDREKIMGDGIVSQVDGSFHTSRASYEAHLKETGHAIVGNDFASKKAEREERLARKAEESRG